MAWPAIGYILGWLLLGFGGFMLFPAAVSWWWADSDASIFLTSGLATMFMGAVLFLMNRQSERSLGIREGFLLTVLAWVGLSVVGAIPLYFSGGVETWIDALFESVSGLTTTGATVMVGLDDTPHGILLWRAMIQWLGGMGIIVLAVAILPFLGVGGLQLYRSELPGVTKDKLQPRLQQTARALWVIYVGLTIVCATSYSMAGMGWFDAICHAFTTIATAGFSTKDASIGAFDSWNIELIAMFFMLLSAVNYTLHFRAVLVGQVWGYVRDRELHVFLLILLLAVGTTAAVLLHNQFYNGADAWRYAMFNVVSILTTTGYSNADYNLWPTFIPLLLLMLMFIGGCSGSTSGGMKVMRVLLLVKQGLRELRYLLHPYSVVHLKVGRQTLSDSMLNAVWSFVVLFLVTFLAIVLLLALCGLDMLTAVAAAAATLTNVGPGLGGVGPAETYVDLSATAKGILSIAMLLGRLELFTLLIVLTPQFWRK